MTTNFSTRSKSVSNHLWLQKRYNYSVSDSNSGFDSNSMSDSNSESESDSNSLSIILVIFIFLRLVFAFFEINLWIILFFHSYNRINSYAGNASVMHAFFWYLIT